MSPHRERPERRSWPVPATLWIAWATLHDALSQRLLAGFGLIAGALVMGASWLHGFHFGSAELKLTADFGLGAMSLFGGVLAITASARFFCGEIEHRTVLTVLAKPVRRSEFVLGKFVAMAAVTAVFCGLMTVALAVALKMREAALVREFPDALAGAGAIQVAGLGLAALAQWLKLVLLAALTLLVASFSRSQLFAVTMGFLVWIVCELQSVAQAAAARSGAAWSRLTAGFIGAAFPDFRAFDLAADPASGMEGDRWLRLIIYTVGYATVVCALAAFSFQRREI